MRQPQQEDSSRRIAFDCELPDNVRTELIRPKRPAILRRPAPAKGGILKWAGAFAFCAIILAGTIANNSQQKSTTLQPDPVLQHSLEIL